jgi:glycosyltransferase involved in cell wall biosynthesis
MTLGKVNVLRLVGSAASGLGSMRWLYSLGRWLRREPPAAVLVAGLKREAMVALRAAKERAFPVMLLADADEVRWQQSSAAGGRALARCREAPVIVAPSEALVQQLLLAGYTREQIELIPRSAARSENRSAEARAAARLALAAVNYDLATTPSSQVALAIGRLESSQRFGDLIRAWRIVTARRPEAKLWIIGDGPERERLYQQIGDLDQRFRVMLPGTFERYDELLAACDMLLVPAAPEVPPLAWLDAIAAGIPVIMAGGSVLSHVIQPPEGSLVYPVTDVKALAESVFRMIEQPENGSSTRLDVSGRTPADEAAEYLALIERLQSIPSKT